MGSGFFFILGIVLSNTYRPYIYENHIFDFHLADTIGNLVAVPSLSLLLLAMRKYESLSKAILYSIFVFTIIVLDRVSSLRMQKYEKCRKRNNISRIFYVGT